MRLKERTKKRIQGSVSVLMIIILLPMMTLTGLIVDMSRINLAKQMMSSAGDLAMNTALANYDTILKDVYGLFAMSQEKIAGLSDEEAKAVLSEDIKDYFEKTLVEYNVVDEGEAEDYVSALLGNFSELISGTSGIETANFLELSNFNVSAEGVKNSSLAEPAILRKQIVEYMKYRAPLNFGMSFLDTLKSFKAVSAQTKVVETQVAAQEKTQNVTEACSKLITLIREYDELVKNINGEGDKKVTGLNSSGDNVTVAIENYDTQLSKYLEVWEPDYTHINKLSLVFLAKNPDISNHYLINLGTTSFIQEGNTGIVEANSGITVTLSPALAEDAEGAKQQVFDQINKLQTDGSLSAAQKYVSNDYVSSGYLNYSVNGFSNEEEAVKTFIAYEKFLLNQASDLNYSDAQVIFEEILKMAKYYNNYAEKQGKEITKANDELNVAKEAVTAAEEDVKTVEDATAEAEEKITEAEAKIKEIETKQEKAKKEDEIKALEEEKENAEADLEAATTSKTEAEAELVEANTTLTEANTKKEECQKKVDGLKAQLENVTSNYQVSLGDFKTFADAYQTDFKCYRQYITAAEAVVAAEATLISEQLTKIKDNVYEIREKLNSISEQITSTKEAIDTYNDEVDKWEVANNNYAAQNSSDSFNQQTASDIATARTQYNSADYDTLDMFVISKWSEFDDFYSYLEEGHLGYGTKKLHEIKTTDDLKTAFSSVVDSLSSVVTVEEANEKLAVLYKQDELSELDPYTVPEAKQLCFLEPMVLQISSLKYLNATYPEGENRTEAEVAADNAAVTDYETEKSKLVSGSGGSVEADDAQAGTGEEGSANKYGYTYQNISSDNITKSELPSANYAAEKVTDSEYKLSEEEGKLNASAGVSQQSGTLSTMLNGIGDAVNAGLENAYILSYIFENFSYNTMIQDAIVEADQKSDNKQIKDNTKLVDVKALLAKEDVLAKYVDKLTTLSNFEKNGKNNYLYGAEVEYILYGNLEPTKNVTYAKASIYALRFGFNCIYAFTNTEIRNTTMSAGLAVQAATLGIVPYQVVQIVLQLALAAAESAIDLDMMNCGLTVAVVKTKDTWMLSVSNAAKTFAGVAATVAADMTKNAIKNLTDGLQGIVDAGATELKDAVYDLSDSLYDATEQAVANVIDQAFAHILDEVESRINELRYIEAKTKDAVNAQVNELFADLESTMTAELEAMFAGNDLAMKTLPYITPRISGTVMAVKDFINAQLESMPAGTDAGEYIISKMTEIKTQMLTKITSEASGVLAESVEIVINTVDDVQTQITSYISNTGESLAEDAAESIRTEVTNIANNYIGKYLDVGNSTTIGGGSTNNSVASMIQFGYRDYLMLFTYLAICVNDETILTRTADMIQLNIQHTGEGAAYKHNQGSVFRMNSARTYVSVSAKAELDMFFINMEIFTNVLNISEEENSASVIVYKGLLGY